MTYLTYAPNLLVILVHACYQLTFLTHLSDRTLLITCQEEEVQR